MQIVSVGVHVLSPGQKVTIYKEKKAEALESPAQTAPENVANRAIGQAAVAVDAASAVVK
jgi:hypothetical protein